MKNVLRRPCNYWRGVVEHGIGVTVFCIYMYIYNIVYVVVFIDEFY